MRITKYRAWDKRQKKMLSPKDLEARNYALGSHGVLVWHDKGLDNLWNVDHYLEPLFWTGIKDSNGIEIYEGDIIETIPKKVHWEIFWSDEDGGYGLYSKLRCEYLPGLAGIDLYTVIGNAYENPELIP